MTSRPDSATTGLTIAPNAVQAGASAARAAAAVIRDAIASDGSARVIFASAPSQGQLLRHLVADTSVDWSKVHALHMDEYVGLTPNDPRTFGYWLTSRLPMSVIGAFDRIEADSDPAQEATRYEELLRGAPVALACMGIGVNGHIAFNEPGQTQFDDPRLARVVKISQVSRQQQVDDELFAHIDHVPTDAISLTVPGLLLASHIVTTVVGSQKAQAVAATLNGPLSNQCPASVLRTHPRVSIHLDDAAAALIA